MILQNRARRGAALFQFEGPLLIFGLSMIAFFLAMYIDREWAYRTELREFRIRQGVRPAQASLARARPAIDFSLWSAKRLTAYHDALTHSFGQPLAVLRISKVNLEVPVLEGVDESVLNRGVGHIPGTALPGQHGTVGIAGHRDSFFRVLKDINRGDTIEVDSQSGATYKYRVSQLFVVDPSDVSVLRSRAISSLTLVTCYPFYFFGSAPKRYIVEASMLPPPGAVDEEFGVSTHVSRTQQLANSVHFKTAPQNSTRTSSKSVQEISQ